jgi:hypothetical protein
MRGDINFFRSGSTKVWSVSLVKDTLPWFRPKYTSLFVWREANFRFMIDSGFHRHIGQCTLRIYGNQYDPFLAALFHEGLPYQGLLINGSKSSCQKCKVS